MGRGLQQHKEWVLGARGRLTCETLVLGERFQHQNRWLVPASAETACVVGLAPKRELTGSPPLVTSMVYFVICTFGKTSSLSLEKGESVVRCKAIGGWGWGEVIFSAFMESWRSCEQQRQSEATTGMARSPGNV